MSTDKQSKLIKPFEPINRYFHFLDRPKSIRIPLRDHRDGGKLFMALTNAERYLNGIILQFNRLGGAIIIRVPPNLSEEDMRMLTSQNHTQFMLDLHFYLICWANYDKYLKVLVDGGDECVKEAWRGIKGLTREASLARNHLEHLSESIRDFGSREGSGTGAVAPTLEGVLTFRYSDFTNKGKRILREVTLGRKEVEMVMVAHERIMSCILSDLAEKPRLDRGKKSRP